ncbi:hypothetical protein HNP55_001726 [Paucibacter oligotrophus]|uniref:Uncharacterized protein n=1 Tax=Roseateles oligotrophus TaxID=1769250 RepID=A0A840LD08_9BURK|nr:hypothetical protein [Roseateles oligotrophus]
MLIKKQNLAAKQFTEKKVYVPPVDGTGNN